MKLEKSTFDFLNFVIKGIKEIKGQEITILDLRKNTKRSCDYFVLCTANSSVQASAISREIENQLNKNLKEKPYSIEGRANAQWVLMDYIEVVIHVFQKEARDFYKLEEFWADAKKIEKLEL